jgi:acyl dehydratase
MATNALLTPDIRALIGKEIAFTAPEELSQASIRKFALAIGDPNPLYADEAYARGTRFGGIVAPPTFVCETWQYLRHPIATEGGIIEHFGVSLPHLIRGGHAYEFYQPVRPDDVITATWRLAAAHEKQGRGGPMLLLTVEITYTNPQGARLATNRETLIYRPQSAHPAPERQSSVNVDQSGNASPLALQRCVNTPSTRQSLAFDDVTPGDVIPAVIKAVSLASMVMYAAAVWDFIPLHYDAAYASRYGLSQACADGQMLGAFLAQLLIDWTGEPGTLKTLTFRLREFVYPGDTLTCRGRVVGKRTAAAEHLLDCELWIDNQHGATVLTPAQATVALPVRA